MATYGPLSKTKLQFKPISAVIIPDHSKVENSSQVINFSKNIPGVLIKNFKSYEIKKKTIVINLGNHDAIIQAYPKKHLVPRTSVILQNVSLSSVDTLLLFELNENLDIGKVVLQNSWNQYGQIADFSKEIPLYKGPQFEIGEVHFDPKYATGQTTHSDPKNLKRYKVKVNLWYVPSKAGAGLHCIHQKPFDFFEVHTQIYGLGRMQKFHEDKQDSKYLDKFLAPGDTHEPFCSLDEQGHFKYPWHQYYGDTECVWLANEFHAI